MIERDKIKREKIKQNEKINRLKVIWKKIKQVNYGGYL